ncbi:MAG: sensor histidine kinase [Chloroflexi bacterium]|uniref:histidine kinase n=1 Tax=Candidatus Chlorohelix allophototropha TaxID=3003348 RepID=A0A8T7M4V1_9CHLR|nr:sensor histidine kinase [Chloroflexota bacterium]WJW70408.1 ATP-binding protein [Chloroflexota bacterium L227-S17]
MPFQVAARTLLHLGAELISSDGVALFELVKNAFDAGSKRVTIDVTVRIPHSILLNFIEYSRSQDISVESDSGAVTSIEAFKQTALATIDMTVPNIQEFRQTILEAETWPDLLRVLTESNSIVVSDTGEGMSLQTLNDVYLTIGTRSRRLLRDKGHNNSSGRPLLGEKGIGRLSAMRLGTQLHVESTQADESKWNVLDIDWSVFSHDSDALLSEFKIEPHLGASKRDTSVSGTIIRISWLTSAWSKDRLETLAIQEFSKLTDPFTETTIFPIQLRFNQEPVIIPRFKNLLLENAHAIVKAQFIQQSNGEMRLSGSVRYRERQQYFALEGAHLISVVLNPLEKPRVKKSLDLTNNLLPSEGMERMRLLKSLGPFNLEIYWYNRRILTALEGIGDRNTVANLVREWGGGIMVFRDGFRVLPYGDLRDDWLDLDRRAFSSSGYKVNRAQLIGRLNITSVLNSELIDQSNREGLRDSEEKFVLISLLKYVIQMELRAFLDKTDKELSAREPVLIEELEKRVEDEDRQLRINLDKLAGRVPEIKREGSLFNEIRTSSSHLREIMQEVQVIASEYEQGRRQLLNLAGIGLSVEVLAHELNRATEHALLTLANVREGSSPNSQDALIRTLEVQLKTLQKRLQILDQLSTAGRQRKEKFDLINVIRDIFESKQIPFANEQITPILELEPSSKINKFMINAVKGMMMQILDNLITNSIYWLRQQRMLDPTFKAEIKVTVDATAKELRVTDNGPGILPGLKERIFEAFVSTKPPGQGKGLGLFIAREIAKYHGEDVFLAEKTTEPDGTYNTFVLTLGGVTA